MQGRIPVISMGNVMPKNNVLQLVENSKKLEKIVVSARGWLFDVLSCVNRIPNNKFLLQDVYTFEFELAKKYPMNNHIKAKIRQQLQILRDRGFLEFIQNGQYKKTSFIQSN